MSRELATIGAVVLLAGCGAQSEQEQPDAKHMPVIRDDAFLNATATVLLGPEQGALNDHGFVQDAGGEWHVFAIADPQGDFGQFNALAHGSASRLPGPMERHPNVLASADLGTCSVLAPHIVVEGAVALLFYTDTQMCGDFTQDVFAMRLATADHADLFTWTDQGVLFEDTGFSRDPFLFYDQPRERWLMYYHRKNDMDEGLSAISFKTSTDLRNWSETTYDALTGVPDTQILPGAAESPQVVLYRGYYYLFMTHPELTRSYADTYVYRSTDLTDFGTFEDDIAIVWTHAPEILLLDGQHYITHAGDPENALGPRDFRIPGVEMAPLDWVLDE